MNSRKKAFKILGIATGLALASHTALAADRKIVILQALTGEQHSWASRRLTA